MTSLKKCPCCGADGVIMRSTDPSGFPIFAAACCRCGSAKKTSWKIFEQEAIDAWNRRKSGWVPIVERLPEKDETVLAQTIDEDLLIVTLLQRAEPNEGWKYFFFGKDDYGEYGIDDIVAWTPLPEKYEK